MVPRQAYGVLFVVICITTVVQSQVYQVYETTRNSGNFKIENVVDGDLRNALASFRNPWSVKSLDLSGNVLSVIDAREFTRFTNLQELKLASNVITGEVDVSSLTRLVTLDVSNNYIGRVAVGSSLKDLYADSNNITSVSCAGSQRGKKFYLASNKFNNLLDLSDSCRRGLEVLNLELNDIDVIDFDHLQESRGTLVTLNLGLNFIYDVKGSNTVEFRQLRKLDLQNNKIAFMSATLNAAKNAEINLSNNMLVVIDDRLTVPVRKIDLRNNEFQCQTLHRYLTRTKSVPSLVDVKCDNKHEKKQGICCENLSAPFPDRLIALKRQEHSLFTPVNGVEDQKRCEKENAVRSQRLAVILKKYNTQVDLARREQARTLHSTLNVTKQELENKLKDKMNIIRGLKDFLKGEAQALNLKYNEDTLQMTDEIVEYFENRYNEEQNKQIQAIKDRDSFKKMLEQQLEERERLEKLNDDADITLQKANSTLTELKAKLEELSEILTTRVTEK